MKSAQSKNGMVVAAHPLAAEAGREILAEGGNAIDAAIAVSLTLGVVEPHMSGLGGGSMGMYSPKGGEAVFLDARSKTPALFTPEYIYPKGAMLPWTPKTGPMSAGVPGTGRMLQLMLGLWGSGRFGLHRLAQRAIEHAETGFPVSDVFIYCCSLSEGTLRHFPESCKTFFKDGRRFQPGDRLVQRDLAATLRAVADHGFEILYTGRIGAAIVEAMHPIWTRDDLAHFDAKTREPLRQGEIATAPPPSRGGAGLLRALESLAHGPKDPAERLAFMIREFERLFRALSPVIGDPDVMPVDLSRVASGEPPKPGGGTSHFTIVDREGNVLTFSQTIGHFFGSGMTVPGTGILLNNELADMEKKPGHPNSFGPNRRAVANMTPTIVTRGGKPWLALGSPGTVRIFPAMTCVLSNILYEGMGLEDAVNAGRCHWEEGRGFLEGNIPEAVRAKVRKIYGGPIDDRRAHDLFFGGMHAAEIASDGTILGVADPRRDGVALGL